MYLIQLLLPLYDNHRRPFPHTCFDDVRKALIERCGGVTAYIHSPAVGLWKDEENSLAADDVVMFEVMAEQLDQQWWQEYRQTLERTFKQQDIVVRALNVIKL